MWHERYKYIWGVKLAATRPGIRRKGRAGIGASGLVVLMLALAGCGKSTQITTHAAGHPISIVVEGDPSIDSQAEIGVISSRFGKVRIEPARVQLDDGGWTTIPEEVPVVVSISRRTLLVAAGSVTINRTKR
jgi:hypothetical protein